MTLPIDQLRDVIDKLAILNAPHPAHFLRNLSLAQLKPQGPIAVVIEAALKESPLIAEAVVIGDRRKFLTALITVDDAAVKAALGDAPGPRDRRADLRAAVQRQLDVVNERLARVEQVKKFTILERAFAIETGELTPTLKIKRKAVNQSFAAEIEAMYEE